MRSLLPLCCLFRRPARSHLRQRVEEFNEFLVAEFVEQGEGGAHHFAFTDDLFFLDHSFLNGGDCPVLRFRHREAVTHDLTYGDERRRCLRCRSFRLRSFGAFPRPLGEYRLRFIKAVFDCPLFRFD